MRSTLWPVVGIMNHEEYSLACCRDHEPWGVLSREGVARWRAGEDFDSEKRPVDGQRPEETWWDEEEITHRWWLWVKTLNLTFALCHARKIVLKFFTRNIRCYIKLNLFVFHHIGTLLFICCIVRSKISFAELHKCNCHKPDEVKLCL